LFPGESDECCSGKDENRKYNESESNLHAPTGDRIIVNESSKYNESESNLHAPTGDRIIVNESSPGAFGIPECMPPVGGGLSK